MKDAGMRASEARTIEVTNDDLPLCCPLPDMRVWDAHPRVYLTFDKSNKVTCPYCGTKYVLTNKTA
jgi:uncharacterized Zn-finger protein